jgi:hypothetical protein
MPSLSERTKVGRKTPNDGKLEISPGTGERLLEGGSSLDVIVSGERSTGRVEAMPCGCGKGGPGHQHYFVQSALLRALPVGTELALRVDLDGRVVTLCEALEPED